MSDQQGTKGPRDEGTKGAHASRDTRHASSSDRAIVADTGAEVLAALRDRLGGAWGERLSEADRERVARACADAARLALVAMSLPESAPLRETLAAEQRHLAATLANLGQVSAETIQTQLWSAVNDVLLRGMRLALAVV